MAHPGRPKTKDRLPVTTLIDRDIIEALRKARPGEVSDEVNNALRFYFTQRGRLAELEITLDRACALQCVKCKSRFSIALPSCPNCGGRRVELPP